MIKRLIIMLCMLCILCAMTGCSQPDDAPSPTATAATEAAAPIPTQTEQPEPSVQTIDLSGYFQGLNGSAVIYDTAEKTYEIHNPASSETRSSPFSTFKIIAALAGLRSGVFESVDTKFLWNGTSYPFDEWNRDLTLKEAFQSSCVWYFREAIDQIGQEAVDAVLTDLSYGNRDIGEWAGSGTNGGGLAELNGFWLDSSLLISPKEQVDVLIEIFENDKYAADIPILKELMLVEESPDCVIYGKTGTGTDAWFVGFAEKNGNTYYFAVRLEDTGEGQKAKEIALNIIKNQYKGRNAPKRGGDLYGGLYGAG